MNSKMEVEDSSLDDKDHRGSSKQSIVSAVPGFAAPTVEVVLSNNADGVALDFGFDVQC
jgi:hypothetical protein